MKKFLTAAIILLILTMIIFPAQTVAGAKTGLNLWWNVVIPALLPFFICSDLLLNLGVLDKLGRGFEGIMGPIFHLPGVTGLGLVMGYTSGFPIGASIAAELRSQKRISKEEGERLISFTNNPSPLFIIGGVATGILETPAAAGMLLSINYGINLVLGFILGRKSQSKLTDDHILYSQNPAPIPPFGALLKNAAQKSILNIAIIGCYLVFFSIIGNSLQSLGLEGLLVKPLLAAGLESEAASGIIRGILEMTLGVDMVGNSSLHSTLKLALCSGLMGFGGISVLAQVSSMVSHTDIKIWTYFKCRLVHGISAFGITYLICSLVNIEVTASKTPYSPNLTPSGLLGFALASVLLSIIWGALKERARSRI